MRFRKPIGVAALVFAAQLSALCADLAVLRNGFSIRHERREEIGNITRLYTDGRNYVDILTDSIASFEKEDVPPPQSPAPPALSATPQIAPAQASARQNAPLVPAMEKVDLNEVVQEASKRYRVDPDFINSVIKAESNFQPHAVSPKGAQGLMQLMPGTAANLGVKNAFDPRSNVEGGTAYLSQLLDLYHDDAIKALAAYNAGENRVAQYGGVPPYHETRAYIARIVRDYNAKKLRMSSGKTTGKTGGKSSAGQNATASTATKTKAASTSLAANTKNAKPQPTSASATAIPHQAE
ncbi:MAG TPA: lytic transglycosylase domain-containing protein [Candidatus Angelobacter sp.]|nr:lytic transglycosylase domain-containing protein [Candidatus Angelobacter sp.]